MLAFLQYYGAAAGAIAALMVALNLGERWTGYAFVIFVTSSISLILWGFLQEDSAGIGLQNIALLFINAFGVYRHLFSHGKRTGRGAGGKTGEIKGDMGRFQA